MKHHEHHIDSENLQVLETMPIDTLEAAPEETLPLSNQIEEYEKKIIIRTLRLYGQNKTKTAKALNVSLRNFYYKLEKYGIDT
jgi:transcriptional regulator with PAS, ATPase and Fis domain